METRFPCKHRNKKNRLNRTMQYGNYISLFEKDENNCPFKSYYVVWKPLFKQLSRFDTAYGLNRTMQYGNIIFSSTPDGLVHGLNRTMQYGNFLWTDHTSSAHISFKSYYVVWKLCDEARKCCACSQFKSYYVVWKHFLRCLNIYIVLRLNRTMQYGNAYLSSSKKIQK